MGAEHIMFRIKSFILVLLLSFTLKAEASEWKVDKSHSNVQFTVTHMIISEVTGEFNQFDAKISADKENFENSSIEFVIDVNSIDTENEKRDAHLKSDDFFNAEKYPKIKFVGTSLEKVGGNKYKLKGNFTMRDVTKPVELDVVYGGTVKDSYGNTRAGFKITGTVNRFDYGLKWNALLEAGGSVVGKDVKINCNIQLINQPDAS